MSSIYYKCPNCRHKIVVDVDLTKNIAVAYCNGCGAKRSTAFKNLHLPVKEMILIAVIEYKDHIFVNNLFTTETL